MRRPLVVTLVVAGLAISLMVVLSLVAPPSGTLRPDDGSGEDIYRLEGYESGVWPYLNVEPEFRTYSPINVVVRGNATEVIHALKERTETRWNTTEDAATDAAEARYSTEEVNLTSTHIRWGQTRGATRYAYVHDGQDGTWVREAEQLHDGTYFGFRHHIRLYPSPNETEPWVAMQVHSEHFDWFTLRHAVHGVQDSQRHLEADLMGAPYVEDVHRVFLGNDAASDSDGWATLVELALVLPMMTLGATTVDRLWREHLTATDRRRLRALGRRLTPRHGLLAATVVSLYLGLRIGGILLERYATNLSVHTIAGIGYPLLAIVLPLATYAIARGLARRLDAAVVASLALGAAVLIDYSVIGVDVMPLDILVHRAGTVMALGLIAAGGTRRARRGTGVNALAIGGSAIWIALLVAALAGWI